MVIRTVVGQSANRRGAGHHAGIGSEGRGMKRANIRRAIERARIQQQRARRMVRDALDVADDLLSKPGAPNRIAACQAALDRAGARNA